MTTRWKLKACPRCGGDAFVDRDMDGWYEQCLLCSYRRELADVGRFSKQPARASEEKGRTGAT